MNAPECHRWAERRTLAIRIAMVLQVFFLACSVGEREQPADSDSKAAVVAPDVREQLAALGYVATHPSHRQPGVAFYDPSQSVDGLNLYVSQHAQEAKLMDMSGETLHTWRYPHRDQLKAEKRQGRLAGMPLWWRTVHLFPNGDLLAQTDYGPLTKLDRDSKLLWEFREQTHHDFDVRADGQIFVIARRFSEYPGLAGRIWEDFIAEVDPEGREVRRVSILKALTNGAQEEILEELRRYQRRSNRVPRKDPLHTNTLEILDGSGQAALPAFRPGNLLISLPTIHRLMVVDFDEERVVWSLKGRFRWQHHPTLLPNGRLLLFDNTGLGERSRALEIDPVTGEETWSYQGADTAAFFSKCCGRTHRLPNGNTLIIDSQGGRAFEVTRAGSLVWEFRSPHQLGGKVAILNDMLRLSPDLARALLAGGIGSKRAAPDGG